jgi:hypothetical protein
VLIHPACASHPSLPDHPLLLPLLCCAHSSPPPLPWCGLLLHPATLEVTADYTRYAGSHISTALCLSRTRRAAGGLAGRVAGWVAPKAHPLLLGAGLNSPATVRLNIYQVGGSGSKVVGCAATLT